MRVAGHSATSSGPERNGWLPFRFKGLATKIYVAFLLAAAIPTSIAGLVGIFFSLDTLKRETLVNLEQEADGRAEALTRFFDQLSSEIRYLASSSAFHDLGLPHTSEPERGREIRARIERDFAAFSHAYPYIYQIRYLDIGGKEVVRVDQRDERIFIVPESELQDKSDRYYVQETLAIAPGDIYVSPLDLNIERGEVEHPEKPVIRFGTPIAGADAKTRGMLIVNLHAGIVLDQVRQMAEARGGNVYLFSRSGFYLSRSAASAAHQSSRMASVEELTETFPRAFLSHILEGNRGTLELGEWIVAFAPVRASMQVASLHDPMEWAVVLAFPHRRLFAAAFNLYMLYGVLIVGLVVTAGAGFILSRHLLRPLTLLSQETGEIARGNFASRVEKSPISGRASTKWRSNWNEPMPRCKPSGTTWKSRSRPARPPSIGNDGTCRRSSRTPRTGFYRCRGTEKSRSPTSRPSDCSAPAGVRWPDGRSRTTGQVGPIISRVRFEPNPISSPIRSTAGFSA